MQAGARRDVQQHMGLRGGCDYDLPGQTNAPMVSSRTICRRQYHPGAGYTQ